MIVYPVNALSGAQIISPHILSFSNVNNIHHRYLKHQALFEPRYERLFETSGSFFNLIRIDATWENFIEGGALIIAGTNCTQYSISLNKGNDVQFSITIANLNLQNGIAIIPIPLFSAVLGGGFRDFNRMNLRLITDNNVEEIYVDYIFIGKPVDLPRFRVEPTIDTQIRGFNQRTNNGQAFGTVLPTLDLFSASYMRIPQDEKKIVDDYIQSVQTNIPHFIDIYPEARKAIPPKYVTLNKGISAMKRAESNFFWNYEMEWLEAR